MIGLKTAEELEAKGITTITVTYTFDGFEKDFTIYEWEIFREGIMDKFYSKDRCKIDFK